MENILRFTFACFFLLLGHLVSVSQGLPPGWEYSPTPSNHIISLPLISEPNINGYLLNPGDYIGVFYTDGNGELACGGAAEWLGDQNTGIIAFGDDSFTGDKDGFSSGETIAFKFYSWSVQKEYDAEAICNDNLPVTCNVFISNGLSGVDSIWANGFFIVASAIPDAICMGSNSQLLVEPSGGSGVYTYNWTSVPAGFSASIANPLASPQVNTTYFVSVQDGDELLETEIFVEVYPPPVSYAGENLTICQDSSVMVSGQQSNGSGFFWSTSGDGTFDNINLLTTTYTPGPLDIEIGGVQLSLTVNPVEPCLNPAISDVELTIIGLPEIEIGDDQTVCENESVFVSASLLNAIQLTWSSSGDGTFSAPTQIETEYFPGQSDIQNGSVEISALAFALTPCSGTSSDILTVDFEYLPDANAGEDVFICEDENADLFGTATNTTSTLWQTGGDGTFEDANALETMYFPGLNDINNGVVEISLTAQPVGSCNIETTDSMILSMVKNPEVFAGNDVSICETSNVQLNGNAVHYDEVMWNTFGDGSFSDPNGLNTIYYPGSMDIANNQVMLELMAQPLFPCSVQAADDLIVYIELLPVADAGDDFTVPVDEAYQLQGEAFNYASVEWMSSGDGTFDDITLLDAIYTPGTNDNQNASVVLSLNALPNSPCVLGAADDMLLTIDTLVGVTNFNNSPVFEVFPNPTKGELFIEIPDDARDDIEVFVINRSGQSVYKKRILQNDILPNGELKIDFDFQPGLYFLQIVYGEITLTKKIVLLKN